MKKITALTVVVLFALGVIAPFAALGAEKTLFQKVSDSFKGQIHFKDKDKIRPIESNTFFQDVYDGIIQGSAKAKGTTLRSK